MQLADQLQAAAAGQADVADDQVEAVVGRVGGGEGLVVAGGGGDGVAGVAQQGGHDAAGHGVVLDQQKVAGEAFGVGASAALLGLGRGEGDRGQADGEGRAPAAAEAGGVDAAAVALDDALGDGQAEAEAAVAAGDGVLDLLEGQEHLAQGRGVDADAGVDHLDDHPGALVAGPQGDAAPLAGELDGVLHQVPERLGQPRRVGAHGGHQGREVQLQGDPLGAGVAADDLDGLADQVVDVDDLELVGHLAADGPHDVQQVVDEAGLQADVLADHLPFLAAVAGVGRVVEDRGGRQQDRVQRRAQLVAEHGQELVLGRREGLGLGVGGLGGLAGLLLAGQGGGPVALQPPLAVDVGDGADPALDHAPLVAHRQAGQAEPAVGAVGQASGPALDLVQVAAGQGPHPGVADDRHVLGVEGVEEAQAGGPRGVEAAVGRPRRAGVLDVPQRVGLPDEVGHPLGQGPEVPLAGPDRPLGPVAALGVAVPGQGDGPRQARERQRVGRREGDHPEARAVPAGPRPGQPQPAHRQAQRDGGHQQPRPQRPGPDVADHPGQRPARGPRGHRRQAQHGEPHRRVQRQRRHRAEQVQRPLAQDVADRRERPQPRQRQPQVLRQAPPRPGPERRQRNPRGRQPHGRRQRHPTRRQPQGGALPVQHRELVDPQVDAGEVLQRRGRPDPRRRRHARPEQRTAGPQPQQAQSRGHETQGRVHLHRHQARQHGLQGRDPQGPARERRHAQRDQRAADRADCPPRGHVHRRPSGRIPSLRHRNTAPSPRRGDTSDPRRSGLIPAGILS